MRYVIFRDDDTNALTPLDCLERLYRPFLDRGFAVNLATIPNVNTEALHSGGEREVFLFAKKGPTPKYLPIGCSGRLIDYLLDNPGYRILQHGCRHEFVEGRTEFDRDDRPDIAGRLEEGRRLLVEAGLQSPTVFVAPYDRWSRVSFEEAALRFPVLSTGWFESGRLPFSWWPGYLRKKLSGHAHWRVGRTILLSHPGCHLSYHHPTETILDRVRRSIEAQRLTVLVTHWWEYFRTGKPDEALIAVLHQVAELIAKRRDVRVIAFDQLISENIDLN